MVLYTALYIHEERCIHLYIDANAQMQVCCFFFIAVNAVLSCDINIRKKLDGRKEKKLHQSQSGLTIYQNKYQHTSVVILSHKCIANEIVSARFLFCTIDSYLTGNLTRSVVLFSKINFVNRKIKSLSSYSISIDVCLFSIDYHILDVITPVQLISKQIFCSSSSLLIGKRGVFL